MKTTNKGIVLGLKKTCRGKGNRIVIGKSAVLDHAMIRIRGNNNTLTIGSNVRVGRGCSFWMEGDNISIVIGDCTTFTHTVHFCAQENGTRIDVGEDCMFSNHIIVRTSDSHPIYDLETKQRINPPASVKIGKHVWVAPHSVIMKKSDIGDGAIIGSHTMVNKSVPAQSLAVGMPMRVVKNNIVWTREQLF